MQPVPHTYQTLYSELAQRSLDASFSTEFNVDGRFVAADIKGRRYWYFDLPNAEGGKKRTYVGPVDDPEITKRVENFKDLKADNKERRTGSTLVREAYLPRPERMTGGHRAGACRGRFLQASRRPGRHGRVPMLPGCPRCSPAQHVDGDRRRRLRPVSFDLRGRRRRHAPGAGHAEESRSDVPAGPTSGRPPVHHPVFGPLRIQGRVPHAEHGFGRL